MVKRTLFLLIVILFGMAACITAQEPKKEGEMKMTVMSVDEFKKQLENPEFLEKVSFFVAYDKQNAVPILVSSSSGKRPERLGPTIKKEILRENVEIKSTAILKTYGSPGCQIMTGFGEYINICW